MGGRESGEGDCPQPKQHEMTRWRQVDGKSDRAMVASFLLSPPFFPSGLMARQEQAVVAEAAAEAAATSSRSGRATKPTGRRGSTAWL
jgi:hypothetical protein